MLTIFKTRVKPVIHKEHAPQLQALTVIQVRKGIRAEGPTQTLSWTVSKHKPESNGTQLPAKSTASPGRTLPPNNLLTNNLLTAPAACLSKGAHTAAPACHRNNLTQCARQQMPCNWPSHPATQTDRNLLYSLAGSGQKLYGVAAHKTTVTSACCTFLYEGHTGRHCCKRSAHQPSISPGPAVAANYSRRPQQCH